MTLYWALGAVAWLAYFAAGETYALLHKTTTLSQFVWNLNGAWPLAVAIAGLVVGVLMVHFYGQARMVAGTSVSQITVFAVFVVVGILSASLLWQSGG